MTVHRKLGRKRPVASAIASRRGGRSALGAFERTPISVGGTPPEHFPSFVRSRERRQANSPSSQISVVRPDSLGAGRDTKPRPKRIRSCACVPAGGPEAAVLRGCVEETDDGVGRITRSTGHTPITLRLIERVCSICVPDAGVESGIAFGTRWATVALGGLRRISAHHCVSDAVG